MNPSAFQKEHELEQAPLDRESRKKGEEDNEKAKNANLKVELFIKGGEELLKPVKEAEPVAETFPKIDIKIDLKDEQLLKKRENIREQAIEDSLFVS